jgi:SAM-dependent methyltransferase
LSQAAVQQSESRPQTVDECPYCEGRRLVVAHRDVRDQLRVSTTTWSFVRCVRCGSLLLSPRPPGAALAAFYPEEYTAAPAETSASGLAAEGVHALEALLFGLQSRGQARIVERLTGLRRGDRPRLLDVGCGSGRQLEQFHRLGFEVRGVDLRPEAVAAVRRHGIRADVCAAERLTDVVEPGSMDVVTAFASLEHADDVRRTVAAFRAVLRPGGWLAAEVPITPCLDEHAFGTHWRVLTEAPRHTTVPSPSGMAALLTATGFEGVRAAADPLIMLAAVLSLSVVPDVDATLVWAEGGFSGPARRLAGGLVILPGLAWAVASRVARRPSTAIVAARATGA